MSKPMRRHKTLEPEQNNPQKHLQRLESPSQQEHQDLHLEQLQALGQAVLSQERGQPGNATRPLQNAQTEGFSELFMNE